MRRLNKKTVIVTGGASGIGLAVASGCVKEGAKVFVADLSRDRCEAACREIGANALPEPVDIRDQLSIDLMVSNVLAKAGTIDVLIQSAGVFGMGQIDKVTPAEFDRIVDVNLKGTYFTLAAVARAMKSTGNGGTIVNIASGAGRRGYPDVSVYSLTKAAVINLTQSAAMEYIGSKIRVNAIAPGSAETPMWEQVRAAYAQSGTDIVAVQVAATPAGRLSRPVDYVGAAIFLASSESAFVVGQTLNVDGGIFMN